MDDHRKGTHRTMTVVNPTLQSIRCTGLPFAMDWMSVGEFFEHNRCSQVYQPVYMLTSFGSSLLSGGSECSVNSCKWINNLPQVLMNFNRFFSNSAGSSASRGWAVDSPRSLDLIVAHVPGLGLKDSIIT